jgi:predicted Rossmann fold nucleotide-binding protein DprA/Smf involved in DNA uptake
VDNYLSPDTQVILLLCGTLGKTADAGVSPLSNSEYTALEKRIANLSLQPADLLDRESLNVLTETLTAEQRSRISILIGRGAALGFALEDWISKGIWVISRDDAGYPSRWRQRLGATSPVLLYGVGERLLLESGGLAVVGSREAGETAMGVASLVGVRCAAEGVPIISGGARGIDSAATQAALNHAGHAVGVLAENLARASVSGANRIPLVEQRQVLVSPYYPYAPFNVGNAMGRNKLIYALADWALVVSASAEKGGTWAGAVEDLRHRWAPLFVSADPGLPMGNALLIQNGGRPVRFEELDETPTLRELFDAPYATTENSSYNQGKLF